MHNSLPMMLTLMHTRSTPMGVPSMHAFETYTHTLNAHTFDTHAGHLVATPSFASNVGWRDFLAHAFVYALASA
jgi:hypothetical protein